jgi:hypothetical protein
MEAVRSSEILDSFYQTTQQNIPEDSYIRTRHRENLKYHIKSLFVPTWDIVWWNSVVIFIN